MFAFSEPKDVIIVGSGPNGLAAGIRLTEAGLSVGILEAHHTIGGGTRTAELTGPGLLHDVCSAVHPAGYLSPYLKTLPLEAHGVEWLFPEASVAHPLDSGEAILLHESVEQTAAQLGKDRKTYQDLMGYFSAHGADILKDSMAGVGVPSKPLPFLRFGLHGGLPAHALARILFRTQAARALFAGCAAHSILPFSKLTTGAMGLMFLLMGHLCRWPIIKGGSQRLAEGLASIFRAQGGEILCDARVTTFQDIPNAKYVLFDTDPKQLADIAEAELPKSYVDKLRRFNFGPGIFKVDIKLDEPIPWRNKNCAKASTVHLGGTLEEIAAGERDAWEGRHPQTPYVLLAQQSVLDETRSSDGTHNAWAYCHVPAHSTVDMTNIITSQIERFAPGFRDTIVQTHTMSCQDFYTYNRNYCGGAITGGATDITQLFTRPVGLFNPYQTPNQKIWICSASTPPGGGVHGMCGFHTANRLLQHMK